jgi:hypothetical protein
MPELQAGQPAKVRITIALDEDIIGHFKAEAEQPGALPYQTQINQVLRKVIRVGGKPQTVDAEAVKGALLEDKDFIEAVAKQVKPGGH